MTGEIQVTKNGTKSTTIETPLGYSDWRQVAGYFDGDGSVEVRIGVYVLRFHATWADTYREQLDHIGDFLASHGLASTIRISKSTLGRAVWHLSIWEIGTVLKAYKRMFPHLDKKKEQVRIAINYLEDKMTAQKAVEILNLEIRKGARSGIIRIVEMPWTRLEGLKISAILFFGIPNEKWFLILSTR